MHGKWLLAGAAIVLAAIAAGALSRLRKPAPAPAAAAAAAAVPAAPIPGGGELGFSGPVRAQKTVPVKAEVEGRIEAFAAEIGQEVFEGQMLARIGNPGLETARDMATEAVRGIEERVSSIEASIGAARLEASRARADSVRSRAEFDRAKRLAERQQMLQKEGATPRLVYEKAQKEFGSAQSEFQSLDEIARQAEGRVTRLLADLDRAKKTLADKSDELEEAKTNAGASEVLSPVDGLLVARKKEVNDQVTLDAPEILEVAVDLSQLEVAVEPKPEELARIKAGQPAQVVVSELGMEPMPAEVAELKGNTVIVRFTSPDPAVKPGMTAGVRIKIE